MTKQYHMTKSCQMVKRLRMTTGLSLRTLLILSALFVNQGTQNVSDNSEEAGLLQDMQCAVNPRDRFIHLMESNAFPIDNICYANSKYNRLVLYYT